MTRQEKKLKVTGQLKSFLPSGFEEMVADLIFAEPKALIGFAGPRVIEQTIRQKLPEGFQRAEFLVEHGMVDMIVDRRKLKSAIADALKFMHTPA